MWRSTCLVISKDLKLREKISKVWDSPHSFTSLKKIRVAESCDMSCCEAVIGALSWGMIVAALGYLVFHRTCQASYGRHMGPSPLVRMVPARQAWFLQELPALLVPILLMVTPHNTSSTGRRLLLATFCTHYFQRIFVYSLLTRGQPVPLSVMVAAGVFCSLNGFLQGHHMLHCAHFDHGWSDDYRFKSGLILFYVGMAINVHSDYILRNLRKPGEVMYKIPTGGMFEYVSGANYLGEIVEWFGYALATWSFPGLSFAMLSLCFIGPRAYHHHRFYRETFKDYPRFRKALIPFIF